jgi:hypothetical protein
VNFATLTEDEWDNLNTNEHRGADRMSTEPQPLTATGQSLDFTEEWPHTALVARHDIIAIEVEAADLFEREAAARAVPVPALDAEYVMDHHADSPHRHDGDALIYPWDDRAVPALDAMPDLRFRGYNPKELSAAIDFARYHGWSTTTPDQQSKPND